MSREQIFVVPAERHVERLARDGKRSETRASLRARLVASLLPEVRFADRRETRIALAAALSTDTAVDGGAQLGLFASSRVADPLIATLRARGGASWVRAVAALDEAIGVLRARGATESHLERVRGSGVAAARARTLAFAMKALDATLARQARAARDGRIAGRTLAAAIRHAAPAAVEALVGAAEVRARWILAWEPDDLAWWRALDEALALRGGFAHVVLPNFDRPLEGARTADPLERLSDSVARQLDAAPEAEPITDVLGVPGTRVRLFRTLGAAHEARVAARLVRQALDDGAAVERVVIAYPMRDERTLTPLRRALEAERIVFHDALGPPPSSVPVVAAALLALAAKDSLDRVGVARLLRSGYVDAARLLGMESFREAERVLLRLARRLESRATAVGDTPEERLVFTAAERGGEDEPAARRVVEAIAVYPRGAHTRAARVRAARALFAELGLAARAGRGALATFARDEAPAGVERATRLAVARDVRAWELLDAALDLQGAAAVGAEELEVDAEVFRLELAELLDGASDVPGAGRAGAVRIARLADVPGDELDLLVVLDANDGVLPRDARPVTLISEALEDAVGRDETELADRDLAALATSAAEAALVALVTTAEDGADGVATPSRVFRALERAGLVPDASDVEQAALRAPVEALRAPPEVARRAERESVREGFFLDPARPLSDLVGALAGLDVDVGGTVERPLAVTSLERFAQCPFKGYGYVVLGARTDEEQRELPDAREEGNLGHSALAAAFLATREQWTRRPRDEDAIVTHGLAAADEVLARSAAHAPLRAVVRLRVRESVRAVLRRAIGEDEWDFLSAEQAFGNGRPWPAFEIAGSLWLRGSIDRVDRAHVGAAARVIDYKRSKSTVKSSSAALGETALQVPIYAAVVARRLGVSATGLYLPVQPRDLALEARAKAKPEERVSELARQAPAGGPSPIERRALDVIASARAARFAPLPAKESECTYCDLSGGCRKPRFAMTPVDEVEEKEGT